MHLDDNEHREHGRSSVDLLILGAGWTSTFLIPLCLHRGVSYAATTRSGEVTHAITTKPSDVHLEERIQFDFDPTSENAEPFRVLPDAKTVLITFPIKVNIFIWELNMN